MATDVSGRVLIVDDVLVIAQTVCVGLCDCGFSAVAASSGRAALALLTEQHFDALVTDLRMPEMDGLTLMNKARGFAPDRPTLIMTAHGAIDSAIESIRQGAYHYLTKPFSIDELVPYGPRCGSALVGLRSSDTVLRCGRCLIRWKESPPPTYRC